MSGAENRTTDEIIDRLLALLDELAKRLGPDMAAAVLREHGFEGSSVDEMRHQLDARRTILTPNRPRRALAARCHVASGRCAAGQIGQCPGDHKRYKVAQVRRDPDFRTVLRAPSSCQRVHLH